MRWAVPEAPSPEASRRACADGEGQGFLEAIKALSEGKVQGLCEGKGVQGFFEGQGVQAFFEGRQGRKGQAEAGDRDGGCQGGVLEKDSGQVSC